MLPNATSADDLALPTGRADSRGGSGEIRGDTSCAIHGRAATGGLAAAIARNREIKQELEKTQRQRAKEQGVKRI